MTEEDKRRVPEGGAWYRPYCVIVDGGTESGYEIVRQGAVNGFCRTTDESSARQICGSVNACICQRQVTADAEAGVNVTDILGGSFAEHQFWMEYLRDAKGK